MDKDKLATVFAQTLLESSCRNNADMPHQDALYDFLKAYDFALTHIDETLLQIRDSQH